MKRLSVILLIQLTAAAAAIVVGAMIARSEVDRVTAASSSDDGCWDLSIPEYEWTGSLCIPGADPDLVEKFAYLRLEQTYERLAEQRWRCRNPRACGRLPL